MPKRPRYQRSRGGPLQRTDIARKSIGPWPENAPSPDDVAKKVSYRGNPQHKTSGRRPAYRHWGDKNRCEKVTSSHQAELETALRDAIRRRVVHWDLSQSTRFPGRVWAYVNDVLHEARLTNRGNGEYHGFPIKAICAPRDPAGRLEEAPRVEFD